MYPAKPNNESMNWFKAGIVLVACLGFFAWFDNLKEHFYIFDMNKLHSIASDVIAKNMTTEDMIHKLVIELNK